MDKVLLVFLILLISVGAYQYFTINEPFECKQPLYTLAGNKVVLSAKNFYLTSQETDSNLLLSPDQQDVWEFETLQQEDCLVYIKTTKKEKDFYLTKKEKDFDPNAGENAVFSSPLVRESSQEWYLVDIGELNSPNIKRIKRQLDSSGRYIFIMTNPGFPEKESFFMTVSSGKGIRLDASPSMGSVWKVDVLREGKEKEPKIFPMDAIGSFPMGEKTTGTFMPEFVNADHAIWNNTFYSPAPDKKIKSLEIKLSPPTYDKENYAIDKRHASGTVEFKDNYETLKGEIFPVKSYGADMLYGKKEGSAVLIKLKQREKNDIFTEDIPSIQGWVQQEDGTTISICGSVSDNLAGLCYATKENDVANFLIRNDVVPANPENNENLSKDMSDTVDKMVDTTIEQFMNWKSHHRGNINNCY